MTNDQAPKTNGVTLGLVESFCEWLRKFSLVRGLLANAIEH